MIFPPYPKKAAFICSQTLLVKNPSLSKIPAGGEGPGFGYPQRGFALLEVH